MRSLLVTGASGFLGWHVCQHLSSDWQIVGTYHHHPITLTYGRTLALDLTDAEALATCWEQIKPDAVLHTAAISKVNHCQQHPALSERVNVVGSVELAKRCAAAHIPFVFTSTDLVFDGTQPPYRETDPPTPINVYGQHKAIAEAQILAAYPEATICRLPLMFGAATPTASCFLQSFLGAIAAGQPLKLFTDEVRTPAEVTDVVRGLNQVLTQGITGMLHLGGPQRMSRYAFGLSMAAAFQVDAQLITPCTQEAVDLPTPRPKDVSLDSRKAFALGYAPQDMDTALQAIARRFV
jgi:dTDP-4-dehydrorhamnose reductase